MSLDDLMNSLESGPPTGGVKVIEERGAVQLRQVPKDELPKGHASLMLLQEKGGHYDAVKERERDEVELNDLITNLDSLGGPPPRERPISRPPPAEAPPPPPPGTLPRGNNYGYTTTAAPRVESYQPAAPSSTASMPVWKVVRLKSYSIAYPFVPVPRNTEQPGCCFNLSLVGGA